MSCTFRQTNIVWVIYVYAATLLMRLRFKPGEKSLHDPLALAAEPGGNGFAKWTVFIISPYLFLDDFTKALWSVPKVIPEILENAIPYAFVLAIFGALVAWNGGIVLGPTIFRSYFIPIELIHGRRRQI